MESKKQKYRILIKNFCKKGYNSATIHRELMSLLGSEAPSYRTVLRWHERFQSGSADIIDKPKPGRKNVTVVDKNIKKVSDLINTDRRLTLKEIAQKGKVDVTSTWRILTIILGLVLRCARWVPKILTSGQKKARIRSAKENISLHNLDSEFFEQQIVTGDETYIHHYEPETKRQSMQWLPPWASNPQKAIRKISAKKVMALVFWDKMGVLLVEFFRKGKTLTGAKYAEILRKLKLAIQSKRGEKWDDGVFLLHDNAPSHTSKVCKSAISDLGFVEISHPPYSPDLAPSDYFLFPHLKKFLRKKSYSSDEEVEKLTKRWLTKQSESFYSEGISNLRYRWDKCVKVKGEYVEKTTTVTS